MTDAPLLALRPYQEAALAAIDAAAADGIRRPLVVLPTGAGKTVVFAHLIRRRPGRALVLAHREELIAQAVDKLRRVDPRADVGVVQAESDQWARRVVVASVPSLAQPARLARYRAGDFATIVVDEAHHAAARTYRTILGHLGALDAGTATLTVGVTATPDRGDGIGLAALFERVVYQLPLLDLIRAGYLVPLRGVRVHLAADWAKLRARDGEVVAEDAARLILAGGGPALVAAAYGKHLDGRRAIVFTPTVAVAEACAAALQAAGVAAAALDGTTPAEERRRILAGLRDGTTPVVCNCGVLTEGFDEPRVAGIVVARPTKSRALYAQMVGRGARTFPGKTHCTVLDLVGASGEHQLVTLADLTGRPLADGAAKPGAGGSTKGEAVQLGVPLGAEDVAGQAVDLFSGSVFRWLPFAGAFVLPAGDGWVLIEEQPGPGGSGREDRWWVIAQRGRDERPELVDYGLDLGYAQGVAEDLVRGLGSAALARRDAAWRRRPASRGQREALAGWGLACPGGTTMGEASDRLTAAIAGAAVRRARKDGAGERLERAGTLRG